MGNNRNRNPLRPLHPVDVHALRSRLSVALKGSNQNLTDSEVVKVPFPAITSLTSVSDFRDDYLLREIVRKYPGYDLGINTRKCALESFLEDEALNRRTNCRLMSSILNHKNDWGVHSILDAAARKAIHLLGRFSPFEFVERVRFGPGATTSLSSAKAHKAWKLSSSPHCSRKALELATLVLGEFPHWERLLACYGMEITVHDEDRLECVPKNALTDRTIGIGPDLNIAMQLAVGSCIRARLYAAGVDLSDQSINQQRARFGSISGTLATLDLKSASNSVTTSLVWLMLGNHSEHYADLSWYRILDLLRVEKYSVDDESHFYELFSAMGNGATFEVESLIFWAICSAVCENLGIPPDVTVYGDDLVVPVECVPVLTKVLEYAGFRLNQEKSFWNDLPSSPRFRESCGKHYLDGMDVTPFYVDTPLTTVDSIVLLANNLVRWATRPSGFRDARVLPVYLWLLSHLPPKVRRCRIPFGPENDGLIGDFDAKNVGVARLAGCRTSIGWTVQVLKALHHSNLSYTGDILYTIRLMEWSQRRFEPPKGKTKLVPKLRPEGVPTSLGFSKRVVTSWPYIGPWVDDENVLGLTSLDVELSIEMLRLLRDYPI